MYNQMKKIFQKGKNTDNLFYTLSVGWEVRGTELPLYIARGWPLTRAMWEGLYLTTLNVKISSVPTIVIPHSQCWWVSIFRVLLLCSEIIESCRAKSSELSEWSSYVILFGVEMRCDYKVMRLISLNDS